MTRPLVTVITPSFNQGRFIRATVESVLSQNYDRIEYIVMDGGSTDETESVVREYSGRVRWISAKDRGQSHAINKGFQLAQGEVVAWLNSDDTFLPGAVQRAVSELNRRPECGAVYGEGYLMDAQGSITGRFPCSQPFDLWRLTHLSDYILQQTLFIRRRVLEELGYLDESLHYAMDWDLLIRIGKTYELGYIPEYMGCLRVYPEAKSSAGGGPRIAEIGKVMRRHAGQRLAPGYIVYGLETYRLIWNEWVRRHGRGFLNRPAIKLEQFIHLLAGWVIDRKVGYAQGWHSRGWVGSRVHLMAPASASAVRVRAINLLRQRSITVSVDGRLQRFPIPPGEFVLSIPLLPATAEARKIVIHPGGQGTLEIRGYENVYQSSLAEPEPAMVAAAR